MDSNQIFSDDGIAWHIWQAAQAALIEAMGEPRVKANLPYRWFGSDVPLYALPAEFREGKL